MCVPPYRTCRTVINITLRHFTLQTSMFVPLCGKVINITLRHFTLQTSMFVPLCGKVINITLRHFIFQTSMFVPPYGTVTNVTVSSFDAVPQVIRLLLDKFKVKLYLFTRLRILKIDFQKSESRTLTWVGIKM